MKFIPSIIVFLFAGTVAFGQSKTTNALSKKYNDAQAFFFYNNTLRMLNQSEDKEFDELIKDIEKMKLLFISKGNTFRADDYKELTADYKKESFEPIMTSRHQGKNFDIFTKEKDGKTNGMLVLVNDSSSLYVLDIVGRIALDKVTKLYNTIDQSSDIGKKFREVADGLDKHKKDEQSHH